MKKIMAKIVAGALSLAVFCSSAQLGLLDSNLSKASTVFATNPYVFSSANTDTEPIIVITNATNPDFDENPMEITFTVTTTGSYQFYSEAINENDDEVDPRISIYNSDNDVLIASSDDNENDTNDLQFNTVVRLETGVHYSATLAAGWVGDGFNFRVKYLSNYVEKGNITSQAFPMEVTAGVYNVYKLPVSNDYNLYMGYYSNVNVPDGCNLTVKAGDLLLHENMGYGMQPAFRGADYIIIYVYGDQTGTFTFNYSAHYEYTANMVINQNYSYTLSHNTDNLDLYFTAPETGSYTLYYTMPNGVQEMLMAYYNDAEAQYHEGTTVTANGQQQTLTVNLTKDQRYYVILKQQYPSDSHFGVYSFRIENTTDTTQNTTTDNDNTATNDDTTTNGNNTSSNETNSTPEASPAPVVNPTLITAPTPVATSNVAATSSENKGVTKEVVNTGADGTASVKSITSKKKSVTVGSTVIVDGVEYSVTSIEKNAFKNCKKAKTINLPSTVTTIKKGAFSGASSLKTLKLTGKKAITVKKGAFKGLDTTKMTIKLNKKMSKKDFKKMQKNLTKAEFKGTVKKG